MDSDPDIEIIEKDSGMSSLGGSKDDTPEKCAIIEDVDEEFDVPAAVSDSLQELSMQELPSDEPEEENYEDEPDETIAERIWALSEMFPEIVRNACESATNVSMNGTRALYQFSCSASWIFFTSSMILLSPILFETERAQMIEMEKSQKQRVLLGPGAAIGGAGSEPGVPSLPPMTR